MRFSKRERERERDLMIIILITATPRTQQNQIKWSKLVDMSIDPFNDSDADVDLASFLFIKGQYCTKEEPNVSNTLKVIDGQ